jgi:hypothetical protein
MKKILLLCGMLLALSATVASAAGINLAWDNCLNGGGVPAKTYACNANSSTQQHMYLSATAPAGIDLWTAFEFELQLQADGATLPAWWQVRGTGQCRNGALTALSAGVFSGCTDVYGGQGGGGLGAYNVGFGGTNRARLSGVWSVPSSFQTALTPEEEYFVSRLSITYAKTVGLGSCAGCAVGVCINGTLVKFVQPAGAPGGNVDVVNPAIRSHILWQNVTDPNTCPGATPSKNITWGRVKTLYR